MRSFALLLAGNVARPAPRRGMASIATLTGLIIAPRQVPSLIADRGHPAPPHALPSSFFAITAPTAEAHEQYANGSSLFYVEAHVPPALAASPGCVLVFSVSDNHTTFRSGEHPVSSIVGAWISPMGQLTKYHCVSCCDFTARIVCAGEIAHEVSVLYRPTICAPAFVAPLIQFLQVRRPTPPNHRPCPTPAPRHPLTHPTHSPTHPPHPPHPPLPCPPTSNMFSAAHAQRGARPPKFIVPAASSLFADDPRKQQAAVG